MTEDAKERFSSPPNLPPGKTWAGRGLFALRGMADLQVASVRRQLKPWLSMQAGSVLEIGCGAQPYRHFLGPSCTYQGLDWDGAQTHFGYHAPDTVYYADGDFPFEDESFDSVFHTEVLEHVFAKEHFLRECRRVLKPSGEMFFTVPFQARYHYIPHDFWRFTAAGLERILSDAEFAWVQVRPRGNDITVAAYKTLSVAYRWLRGGVVGKALGVLAAPVALIALAVGQISLRLGVGSTDDCLGYAVSARRVTPESAHVDDGTGGERGET